MWKIAPSSLLITVLGDWRAEEGDFYLSDIPVYQILPDSFFNPFNSALSFTSIMLMA